MYPRYNKVGDPIPNPIATPQGVPKLDSDRRYEELLHRIASLERELSALRARHMPIRPHYPGVPGYFPMPSYPTPTPYWLDGRPQC